MSRSHRFRSAAAVVVAVLALLVVPAVASASDADLRTPDLHVPRFFGFLPGWWLLFLGLVVPVLGLAFGTVIYRRLKAIPVHPSMRDVSELIYATCKTYMTTQLRFILLLEVFIGAVLIAYFGFLAEGADGHRLGAAKVTTIIACSLVGIFGSYGVSWFGIRINTFANSRAAMGSLGWQSHIQCMPSP